MLTNYVFMIPIRSKSTEEFIKAYFTGVYSTLRGRKYILSDHGSQFTSKQFEILAKELCFIKAQASPYTLTGNSIIECAHSFLRPSIRKLISNNQVDWDETVHIATIVYNVFPNSLAGQSPFYLMFACDPFMPTLFKLLLPKLTYLGDEKWHEKVTWFY